MILRLPWPCAILSPNNRSHYQAKAKARAAQLKDSFWIAKAQPIPKFENKNIPLKITFYPPDNRRRDLDNLLSSCKGMCDGIAQAWGIDDSRFRPISIDFGEVRKRGEVEIEIYS